MDTNRLKRSRSRSGNDMTINTPRHMRRCRSVKDVFVSNRYTKSDTQKNKLLEIHQQMKKSEKLNYQPEAFGIKNVDCFRIELNPKYAISISCPIRDDTVYCKTVLITKNCYNTIYDQSILSWNTLDDFIVYANNIDNK